MPKRKLSILQMAYREFFLALLAEYEVNSPAKLSDEQKREFFTRIKEGWRVRKAEIAKQTKRRRSPSNKAGYAKVKGTRPSIALEPKSNYASSASKIKEVESKKILSSPNPEQTEDLRINFHPNQFFEQDDPYHYPVVKMPQDDSYLKLPRKGRAMGKGHKEDDFHKAILTNIPGVEVDRALHLTIPHFNKPYEPDIVIIDRKYNLYIDIEIDEPYDGYYRYPTHETEKDETRDLFFTESGWIVIRFTERQVHQQEQECIAYIKDVLNSIYTFQLEESSQCTSEPQWDYQQAVRWEKMRYREKYLGIDRFGKQQPDSEIIVDINEIEIIEDILVRTKKRTSTPHQDNIGFEEEAHKYHHPKDETGNAEYVSVTTLIDRFFPFDIDRYIQVKAKKEERKEEEVLEEFLKLRDEAAEKGTFLHEQIENFLKGKDHDTTTKEYTLFKTFYNQNILAKGFHFVEAEKRILLEDYNIAGTVDAIFKKPNKEEYIIVDWKRSKKLVIDGHPKKYGYGYALSELSHLDNSSYFKYALQQNIYKHILEKKYNLKISSMNLIVLHEYYDTYHRVVLDDFTREVSIIFDSINHKI